MSPPDYRAQEMVRKWYANLENALNTLVEQKIITPDTTVRELLNTVKQKEDEIIGQINASLRSA